MARGRGGLVSSVYSDDAAFTAEVVLGLAPYHGRVFLGSAKIAEASPGPGTVLPQLVHGGPGRAGGGEELGGLRGLAFYMQRVALEGSRPSSSGSSSRLGAMASPETEARIRALPKVELHQHVDGSIPAEVTWELMRHYRLNPVETLEEMRRRLELQDGRGRHAARLPRQDALPALDHPVLREHRAGHGGHRGRGGGGGREDARAALLADHPHLRRPHARASRSAPCSPA